MTLLAPLALLWLGSIPVLIWLWRFAASRRKTVIPSLIPFEHLLRRPPKRRTRLHVNWLFWLQLAALILIALALAEPILVGHRTQTVLVLIDTSASMGATTGSVSPWQRAKQHLLARIARKGRFERFYLVTTAPVNVLTSEPTGDLVQLRQVVQGLSPSDLSGNLSVAHRLGEALLGRPPDATLVLTDEPVPEQLDPTIEFQSFGQPLPNVAIVGVDAHESLCLPQTAQILLTVQNFAASAQQVNIGLWHEGLLVTETSVLLEPEGETPLSFSLPAPPFWDDRQEGTPTNRAGPEGSEGLFEVRLKTEHDALAVDNHTFVGLRGREAIPVVVASDNSRFVATIGSWLDACPRISWQAKSGSGTREQLIDQPVPDPSRGTIFITDRLELAEQRSGPVIVFTPDVTEQHLVLTHWLVDSTHPIGSYLEPLETVATGVGPSADRSPLGEPVLWGLLEGRKTPLVSTTERDGRRMVSLLLDPTATPTSVPVVLVFLNSLRWLTGSFGFIATGEPLMVGPLEPGSVRVQRPNGVGELRTHAGGLLRYDETQYAGRYRFIQGRTAVERVVNFLDPVESNTMKRVSTWSTNPAPTTPSLTETVTRQSLVNSLLGLLLTVLLLEWVLYSRKGRKESIVHRR